MLLVFFLLLGILQRSLPSQGESHQTLKSVFSNWRHLVSTSRNSLVAIFRLFLILGRRNLRRFSFWDHQMIFYGTILRPSPYPNALFPPYLHFCLGPHAVPLKSWILGSFHSSLFLHPWKTRILLLNLILTTRSLPPFEKLLCLPLADNHLNLLVVKIHVLCTYSKLVQMEGNMTSLWCPNQYKDFMC